MKIEPINSTGKIEETAVHIIERGHSNMYTDKRLLEVITNDIDEKNVFLLVKTKNKSGLDRFVYTVKDNINRIVLLVCDLENNNLNFVTAYLPRCQDIEKQVEKQGSTKKDKDPACIIYKNCV